MSLDFSSFENLNNDDLNLNSQGQKEKRKDIIPLDEGQHPAILVGITDLGTQKTTWQGTEKERKKVKLTFQFPHLKQLYYVEDTEAKAQQVYVDSGFSTYFSENNKILQLYQAFMKRQKTIEAFHLSKQIQQAQASNNQELQAQLTQQHQMLTNYSTTKEEFEKVQLPSFFTKALGQMFLVTVKNRVNKNDASIVYSNISSIEALKVKPEVYFGVLQASPNAHKYNFTPENFKQEGNSYMFICNDNFYNTDFFSALPNFLRKTIKESKEAIAYAQKGGIFKEDRDNGQAAAPTAPTAPQGTPPQSAYQSQPLPGQAPVGNPNDTENWNPNDANDDLPF